MLIQLVDAKVSYLYSLTSTIPTVRTEHNEVNTGFDELMLTFLMSANVVNDDDFPYTILR